MGVYSSDKLVDLYVQMGVSKSNAISFVRTLSKTDIAILLNNPTAARDAITDDNYSSPSKQLERYLNVPSMDDVNGSLSECFKNNGWNNDPLVKQLGKEARERKAKWDVRKDKLKRLGWLIIIILSVVTAIVFI